MHLLNVNQLSKLQIEKILNFENNYYLSGYTLATLFYEPSTRTRLSFEVAMQKLGGNIITVENGKDSSSNKKGENLRDTILTVSQYSDIIVIRHPQTNILKDISEECEVPIINAGDGFGEHPTQGLLDLYTIKQYKGQIDGLTIMISGDLLHSRTVHSLIGLLKNYDVKLILHSPESLSIPDGLNVTNRDKYLSDVDILYVTRPQIERWNKNDYLNYNKYISDWQVMQECLDLLPKNSGIMHPLPRTQELPEFVDKDERCLIWKQVKNGVHVRMAVICNCLNFPEITR